MMELGAMIKVLDDMSIGSLQKISNWRDNSNFEIIVGNIKNPDIVKDSVRVFSFVFNQAVKASVPYSVENPAHVTDINVMSSPR